MLFYIQIHVTASRVSVLNCVLLFDELGGFIYTGLTNKHPTEHLKIYQFNRKLRHRFLSYQRFCFSNDISEKND